MLYQNETNTVDPSIADSTDYQTSGTVTPESTEYPRPPFIDEHSVIINLDKRKPGDSPYSTGGQTFKVLGVAPGEENPTEDTKQTVQSMSEQMSKREFVVTTSYDQPGFEFFSPYTRLPQNSRYSTIRSKRHHQDPLEGLGSKCKSVNHHFLAASINVSGTLQGVRRRIGKDWAEPVQISVADWKSVPPEGTISFRVTNVNPSSCSEVPYDEERLRPFKNNLKDSEWVYTRNSNDDNQGAFAKLTRKVPGSGEGVINTFGVDKAFARSVEMGERHHPEEYIEGGVWPLEYAQ